MVGPAFCGSELTGGSWRQKHVGRICGVTYMWSYIYVEPRGLASHKVKAWGLVPLRSGDKLRLPVEGGIRGTFVFIFSIDLYFLSVFIYGYLCVDKRLPVPGNWSLWNWDTSHPV